MNKRKPSPRSVTHHVPPGIGKFDLAGQMRLRALTDTLKDGDTLIINGKPITFRKILLDKPNRRSRKRPT